MDDALEPLLSSESFGGQFLERLDGRRVLVADDNATNRQIIQHVLESVGVEAICVADALQALSALLDSERSGAHIDLALLDFQMPRMDGLTLIRAIRAQRGFKRLPIVLLTSVTQRDHVEAARELDIQGYLVKPIHNSELIRTIQSLLASRQKNGEPATVQPRRFPVVPFQVAAVGSFWPKITR